MNEDKYKIIYADPPWFYKDKASSGKRGACYKYSLMTDSDIQSLPIQSLTHDDCVLFLWATFPKLQEALDTIKSWGFTYKTVAFTWVKLNKKQNTPFMGMGRWTRSNAEICLLATKGKPKRISKNISSIIQSPREQHSKKPDIIRNKIVQLIGDEKRLELFARQQTDGWDVYGNEVDGSIELPQKGKQIDDIQPIQKAIQECSNVQETEKEPR